MARSLFVRVYALCAAVVCVVAWSAECHATPLSLVPTGLTDISTAFTSSSYNATTDVLSVSGVPLSINYDAIAPPDAQISSGGVGFPASYTISVLVDINGALVGPGTATDLSIIGQIAAGPHPSAYGTLLSGRVIAFGYSNSAPNRFLEFVFEVTGGSQAPQFGSVVGVIFDTIDGFSGTFATNFSTSFTGNADNFAIPEPSTSLLLAIGTGVLSAAGMRRRRRTH